MLVAGNQVLVEEVDLRVCRVLMPALESLGARAEGGLLRGAPLRGWIVLPVWERKSPRYMTRAMMILPALVMTSLVLVDSVRVSLRGTLWKGGLWRGGSSSERFV